MLVAEMRQYIHHGGAQPQIIHSGSTDDADPSGAGANHGDRVIAAALAQFRYSELRSTISRKERVVTGRTFFEVRQARERARIQAENRYW
jgi:hypothetical protein